MTGSGQIGPEGVDSPCCCSSALRSSLLDGCLLLMLTSFFLLFLYFSFPSISFSPYVPNLVNCYSLLGQSSRARETMQLLPPDQKALLTLTV